MSEVDFREKKCINFFDKKFISRFIYLFYCFTISNCNVTPNDNTTIQNVLDYKTNKKDINKFDLLKGITQNYTNEEAEKGLKIIANKGTNTNKKTQGKNTKQNNELTVQQFYQSLTNIAVNDKLKLSLFGLNVPLKDDERRNLDKDNILGKISTDLAKNECGYKHLTLLNQYLNWNFLYYVHYILKLDITIPITVFLSILAEDKNNDNKNNKQGYSFLGIKTLDDFLTKKNILQNICKKLNDEEKQGQNELRNFIINTISKISNPTSESQISNRTPDKDKDDKNKNIKHINQQLNNFKHNCANKDNDAYKLYKSILYTFRIAVLDMLLEETDTFCKHVYPYLFSIRCGKCGNKKNQNVGCIHNKACLKSSIEEIVLIRNNPKENAITSILDKNNPIQERFNYIYKKITTGNNLIRILFKGNLYQFYLFNEILKEYKKKNLYKNEKGSGIYLPNNNVDMTNVKEKYKIFTKQNKDIAKIYEKIVKVLNNVNEKKMILGPINCYIKYSNLLSDF